MTRSVDLSIWASLLVLLVVCEVLAIRSQGRFGGLGQFFEALSSTTPRITVLFLGWAWLGWHFFAR